MSLQCKNCSLFNSVEKTCNVNVVVSGELLELKVLPEDECFWVKNGIKVQELETKKKDLFT